MTNTDFEEPVGRIVDSYLRRLRNCLQGFPEADREELIREIYSHIYESYQGDSTENRTQRILDVLERLGEPRDVVAGRVSASMRRMGKKRGLPFYILAGALIGIFGLPLGLGGLAVLIGLGIVFAALVFNYYVIAGVLVLSGWITFAVTIVRLFAPDFLVGIVGTLDQFFDPPLSVVLNLLAAVFCTLIGLGLFRLGRPMLRGVGYIFRLPGETLSRLQRRRKSASTESGQPPLNGEPARS
jgi:uncharacterized membrane protein